MSTFYRSISLDDKITPRVYFDGFDGPTDGSFGGRRIKDYLRQEYWNQHDELVATFICSRMRYERTEMQAGLRSRAVQLPHPWTDDQIEAIEADILAESPRGSFRRYLEDVRVGEEIDVVAQGPIGLTDEFSFIAAGCTG